MKRRLADRRGRPRFEIVGELWGTLETVMGMPLVNISHGGALIESAVTLPYESVHHVTVNCDGQATPASVRVRHVRPAVGNDGRDCFFIGVEFLSMSGALKGQIDYWLQGGPATASGVD